jgi:hypothetical protein
MVSHRRSLSETTKLQLDAVCHTFDGIARKYSRWVINTQTGSAGSRCVCLNQGDPVARLRKDVDSLLK